MRRPPKKWWYETIAALKRDPEISDPASLAGWIWYHHMRPAEKKKAVYLSEHNPAKKAELLSLVKRMIKMAKKKKSKSKRRKGRKATAAQLRALRKARAAAAKKRRGKKAQRSSRPKAKKHKRPKVHKSSKRKAVPMAKKRKGGRRRGRGGKKDIMHLATKIGVGAAGAIVGALVTRQVPVDAKVKPFIPIAAGIAAAMFIRNPLAGYAGVGMAIAGALAAIKTFAPNVPMLAGVDDEELIYADGAAPGMMLRAPRVLNGVPVEYAAGVPVEYADGDQDLVDVLQGY